MLVKKFQKFSKKNRFGKSSKYDSKKTGEAFARDYKKRTCHKCKKPDHYIADCPLWENESKKKKKSKDRSSDEKKKSSKSSSKSSSYKKCSSSKHVHSSARKWILRKNPIKRELRNLRS
jgi:hypothetical protein